MHVILMIESGPFGPLERASLSAQFTLLRVGQAIRVGRAALQADMTIHLDPEMSPVHFEVSCGQRTAKLRDLNSRTGTFLNGTRVTEAVLRAGDQIRAGQTTFRVQIEGGEPISDEEAAAATVTPFQTPAPAKPVTAASMRIVSDTPLRFAPLAGRVGFPGHSLTLIVKGTFDLHAGGPATLVEEQPFPTGDKLYPDDDEMQGSPRYESDFAYFKPKTDLLLVGKCHAPGGQPAETCEATFRVGSKIKTLRVAGNRRWEKRLPGWKAGEPEPFTEMELRYENSFGGAKHGKNPVGKGADPVKDDQGQEVWPLPNIENPGELIQSAQDHPEPAGFGPLGRTWETRHAKMGTYDQKWLKTRWPWFAEDFDWTHFNAAPQDMQAEGYLRGDEELHFENLHPVHARYHSRLPGLRVRCFLNRLTRPGAEETEFVEVPMNLDTLWVDMEAEKLVLVWRGWAEVLSEDYEEVRHVFIMSEPLGQAPASAEQCYQRFLAKQAEEEEGFEPEEPEAGDAEEQAEGAPEAPGEPPEAEPRLDAAELEAQTGAMLAQMGIDPNRLPPEAKARQARLIQKLTETDPAKVAEMERQELETQMRDALAKLDLDPDHLPPVSAKAKAEQVRLLKELGMKEADLGADPEFARFWAMMGAVFPKMGMDPENLDPLIHEAKKQRERLKAQFGIEEEEEEGPAEAKEPAAFTREAVEERAAKGQSLEGADLRGLDLSGLDLKGADLTGANLAGANLQNAVLAEANLTKAGLAETDLCGADLSTANLAGADLAGARLIKACLKEADLTGAKLPGADLTGAMLDEAVFEEADLSGAVLAEASAAGAYFPEADLTGARFEKGACPKADFSKATLNQADFQGANLCQAFLEGASGQGINLAGADLSGLRAGDGCDFSGGIFRKALGNDSIWEKANLTGSDFRYARMEGATFTAACLKQADLSAANMKFGRFNKANLREAKLVVMNLFEGSLEKADLSHADLSGSNLYGVEFLDALLDSTVLRGTNLKMTKLCAS